jgi:hypothetical protein
LAKIAYDYATDFIKAELQVGLHILHSGIAINVRGQDLAQYSPCWNNRPAAPQQDLLLALSFCRAVYG